MSGKPTSWADASEAKDADVNDVARDLEETVVNEKEQEYLDRRPVAGQGLAPNEAEGKVEISGGSADVIYKSAKSFDDLNLSPELLKGVTAMGFTTPSKIQADALPIIVNPKRPNMIAQAHHGSGKTATYSLGMLAHVDPKLKEPQCLCICPARELALQVADVISKLAKYTDIKVFACVKGAKRNEKVDAQIVVGTAGSILGKFKHKEINPKKFKMLVLDEADVMVDQLGAGKDMLMIKKQLNKNVQVLLFSATYADRVRKFAAATAPKAVSITVKRENLSLDAIKQYYVRLDSEAAKFTMLKEIYELLEIGQSIIFVSTRVTAKTLTQNMVDAGYKCSLLMGGAMEPEERDRVMDDFRHGRTTVLITTNVLARGIDVSQITLVVNYEIPVDRAGKADPETYIHRIGRSGRFGRKGVAINFVHDEKSHRDLKEIAIHFQKDIKELPNDVEELSEIVKNDL